MVAKNTSTSGNTCILIVEDEPLTAATIEHRLQIMGYTVAAITSSGEDALQHVAKNQPDLILMDIQLAGDMDGVETAEQIHRRFDIPVIYLTANDDDETLQRARITEPYGYLLKPFSERELHSTIEIALYKHETEKKLKEREAQLRQAQRLEAIGILAGGIAHDFNNILGTILGYTELLLAEQPGQSEGKEFLEQIYQAGERAEQLVQQILMFSRSQEQQLTPTDVTPILKESLKMIRSIIPATITIRPHIQEDCPRILADATQIHQIIVNLCMNASHAMREDGGILEISLEQVYYDFPQEHILELTPGSYLKLTVRDTGCGMSSEVQEHIFEPFFTTKAVGEGSGLGLSVVHGIVRGHQGIIAVNSKLEQGTTFRIFFPTTETVNTLVNHREEHFRKGEATILLVDDEPGLAKVYEIALTELGYQVIRLHDGHEALETFRAHPEQFDLIFTDQAMPKMTGVQLSRECLQIRPDIPIILTTGYSEHISEEEAIKIGIQEFLMKPVKIGTLIQAVQNVLGKSLTS